MQRRNLFLPLLTFVGVWVAAALSADAWVSMRPWGVASKTFDFVGTTGMSAFPAAGEAWQDIAWAAPPWEKFQIKIISVSMDLNVISDMPQNAGPFVLEGFIGNSCRDDQMTQRRRATAPIGSKSLGLMIDQAFPYAAGGFPFAAATREKDPTRTCHLDAHVRGTPGLTYSGSITVWYTR